MAATDRPQVVLVNRSFVELDDGQWLIVRRSLNDRSNPGMWETPGGKLDKGQDLIHAQEREVLEETGLLVESIMKLVFTDSFVIGEGPYAGMTYVVLFSITRVLGGTLKLSEEHTEYARVTYDEMLTFNLTPEVRKAAIMLKKYLTK